MFALDENYLNFNIQALTIFGMWNPFSDDKKSKMYMCYSIVLFLFAGVTHTLSEIIHVWKSKNDIVMLTQRFTIATGMISTMIKVISLWKYKNNIKIVIDLLNWERRQPCNRKFAIYRDEIITSTVRACRIFSVFFIVMVFWYSIFTYGKLLVYHRGNMEMLPLSPLLPVHSNDSTLYWLLFTIDEVTFFYIAGAVASYDSLFMVFLMHLIAQLDLLKCRLEYCDGRVDGFKNIIDNDHSLHKLKVECICRTNWQELLINPIHELNTCVKHHQQILKCIDVVQTTFNDTLLLQFASSLVMITMIGFQFLGERAMSANDLIEAFSLLACALFQLFLYCWFGTDIIAKSESIGLSAYFSSWYIADEKFKKTLTIILCRGQKPMKIRAGYICELSASTFVNIIGKCYSSMALLKQVNE